MPANPNKHYTNYLQIKGNGTEAVKFTQNADKTLNFKPGTNVSISATSGEITISATDTNTATAADNILDGSNSGTQITYAPYASQQSRLSFDTSTTNPTRTDRLNLNGYLYATKLYSGGKEVFTSHQSIKSLNTNNTAAQAVNASETIAGSGTINLHKVAKTGSYNDLSNKPTIPDISGLMPKSGGTFTGEVKFGSAENFQGYYIKRMLGSLGIGTAYNNLDSSYKDGTYHRMWRLRFPSGSSFWGKIKVTLYGDYSSFNASGLMSKSITCNFNTSNIYNNVGCYDGLGVNVEQDFRISEAIWNATASAWEILIWQQHLNGNNPATIMLECWTKNNTNYINAFNGIAAQPVELTKSTSYSAQRASSTGGTKTVEWATLPVYENPLGEEIATVAMLKNKQDKITSSNKLSASLVSDLAKVATSGSYNDLLNKPTKLSDFTDDKVVKFTNTTVAASAFVADNNYSNYGYCASISLSGVTANDTADIYFSGKQVEQEIYASFCESYAGGVKIYAAEKPSEAVIIPLILIHK